MATIDSNIALGVKPIQIENPMNQYAALSQLQANQNQNALAQYQLSAAQRTDQKANFLNESIAKNTDLTTGKINQLGVYSDLAKGGFGSAIPELQTKFSDIEHKENVNKKNVVETTGLEFKQRIEKANKAISDIAALNSPQDALAGIERHLKAGDIDQVKADLLKQSIAKAPDFKTWQKTTLLNILDAKDKLVTEETARHNTRIEGIQQQNANTSAFSASTQAKSVANAANPDLQATLAGAKKTAELNATETISQIKDVEGARKVLKTIGLDPKTGANKVTDLIKKSTGSYGGALVDAAGRVFGESTEGADAIGQLKTFETKIATDLLGGKLGAGISNTDREFIIAGLGQISDNTLPRDTREKAWGQVVDRMRSVGLLDTPTKANSSNAAKPSLNDIFGK